MKAGLTVCRVEGGYALLKLTICIVVNIFLLGLMASFQVRAVAPPKSKECQPSKGTMSKGKYSVSVPEWGLRGELFVFGGGLLQGIPFTERFG